MISKHLGSIAILLAMPLVGCVHHHHERYCEPEAREIRYVPVHARYHDRHDHPYYRHFDRYDHHRW